MHTFLSNLANRQTDTDRQTNKRGQKHVPPPLSEVNIVFTSLVKGGTGGERYASAWQSGLTEA